MKATNTALPRTTKKQLAAYAAMGVAGAVSSQTSQAAVVINSGSIVTGPGGDASETNWAVDLNGDAKVDINLVLDSDGGFLYPAEPGPKPLLKAVGGTAPGSVAAVARGVGYNVYVYAQKFASSVSMGTSIGSNASSVWATAGANLRNGSGFVNSRWVADTGPGFLGVQFDIGGSTHYGFVEVSIPSPFTPGDNAPLIGTYGYQDVAGANVHIPEPTSLSLLALGATGLASLRRRRKKS